MQIWIREQGTTNREIELQLESSITLEALLCILQDEMGIVPGEVEILHNNRILINLQQSLDYYGIQEGNKIIIRKKKLLPSNDRFLEGQKLIEQAIRQQQINETYEKAMEWNPESFVPVEMLYIECELNKHPLRAFVDTGAQKSIIGPRIAEACQISTLIDRRFEGVAIGVGQSKIIGSLHYIPVKIGKHFLPCSLSVVEGQDDLFILGLDMLKKHQMILDFKEGALTIQGDKIPFVSGSGSLFSSQSNNNNNSNPPKSHLQTLIEMGASESAAISALEAAQGDLSLAISFCFE